METRSRTSDLNKQFICYTFVRLMSGSLDMLSKEEFENRLYGRGINYIDYFNFYIQIYNNPNDVIKKQFEESDNAETLEEIQNRIYKIYENFIFFGPTFVGNYISDMLKIGFKIEN
jgi:hypothetical protein